MSTDEDVPRPFNLFINPSKIGERYNSDSSKCVPLSSIIGLALDFLSAEDHFYAL